MELVERLLESGADVNARSEFKTPLHLACALSKLDLIELLVHRGADVKLIETELQRYIDSTSIDAQLNINNNEDLIFNSYKQV